MADPDEGGDLAPKRAKGQDHATWMRAALEEAETALAEGEVPVGCVLVDLDANEIVATGRNATIATKNATRHAELVAIDQLAAAGLLDDPDYVASLTLYVTIEPCIMCAGALSHMGISRVVYGSANERFGGWPTIVDVPSALLASAGTRVETTTGICECEAIAVLKRFYDQTNPLAPAPTGGRATAED